MYDEQESREPEIAPELIALERQLRGISPAAPRIDRDRLMFAAGEAAGTASTSEAGQDGRAMYDRAGRPLQIGPSWAGRQFWPAVAVTMSAATLLLAATVVWQRQTSQVASQDATQLPTTVAVSEQPPIALANLPGGSRIFPLGSPAFQQASNNGYLSVRYVALRRDVDALEQTFQATTGDRDSSSEKPRTQRNMLEELLPSSRHAMNPRS
jgi:hypothetical protein